MPTEPIRARCNSCKQSVLAIATSCYYCGQKFGNLMLPAEEPPPTQRSPQQASIHASGALSIAQHQELAYEVRKVLHKFGCELDSFKLTLPSDRSSASLADDGSGPPRHSAKNPVKSFLPSGYYQSPLRFKAP